MKSPSLDRHKWGSTVVIPCCDNNSCWGSIGVSVKLNSPPIIPSPHYYRTNNRKCLQSDWFFRFVHENSAIVNFAPHAIYSCHSAAILIKKVTEEGWQNASPLTHAYISETWTAIFILAKPTAAPEKIAANNYGEIWTKLWRLKIAFNLPADFTLLS